MGSLRFRPLARALAASILAAAWLPAAPARAGSGPGPGIHLRTGAFLEVLSRTDEDVDVDQVGEVEGALLPCCRTLTATSPGGGLSTARATVQVVESPGFASITAAGAAGVAHPLIGSEDHFAEATGKSEFGVQVCVGEPAAYSGQLQATIQPVNLDASEAEAGFCCDANGEPVGFDTDDGDVPPFSLPLSGSIAAGDCVDFRAGVAPRLDIGQPSAQGTWSLTLSVSSAPPTEGDVFLWTGGSSGSFGDPSNWDPFGPATEGVPTFVDGVRSDALVVNVPGAVTIDLGPAVAALARGPRGVAQRRTGRAVVTRADPLRFPGGTLLLDSLDAEIEGTGQTRVGRSLEVGGGASLRVDQDPLQARHVAIGSDGPAELVVTGPNGVFSTLGRFGVGASAQGSVEISGGASATCAESVLGEGTGGGAVRVADRFTNWTTGNLALGFASSSSLVIEDGGLVVSENAFVDCGAGTCTGLEGDERATVLVTGKSPQGDPSRWEVAGNLEVGPRGKVSVEGGGEIVLFSPSSPNELHVGRGALEADCIAGQACVEVVEGSIGPSSLNLTVGKEGAGRVRIQSLGRIATASTFVGFGPGPRGDLVVVGPSAEPQLSAFGGLSVGVAGGGNGLLQLQDGARVSGGSGVEVGSHLESAGVIEIVGGTSAPDSTVLLVGVDADLVLGAELSSEDPLPPTGELRLQNGRVELDGGDLEIRSTGRVSGSGRIDAFGASSVVNDGEITCGVTIVDASYVQGEDGVLGCASASAPGAAAQLNPLAASSFARALRARPAPPPPPPFAGPLVVEGDATLAGRLLLQFYNGFAPRTGDAFEVLDVSGAVTGAFADVAVRGLAPGADFAEDFVGGKLTLTSLTDAEPLPTVSLKAKPLVKEKKKRGLKLKLTRAGDTSQPLAVRYFVRGSATPGVDYEALPGVVEIPAKKKSAKLAIRPFSDGIPEGAETIELEVLPGEGYTPSLAAEVAIEIDDTVEKKRR
jgi:hypothetical protein